MSNDDTADVIPLFKEDPEADKRQRMIEYWEALYMRHGQTLTDATSAASLHVAMEMVILLLNGAHASDVIDETQRDQLAAIAHTGHAAADEFQK
ncbi:hypothetical protein [Streptomyces sp. V1I1]|uniref:hypothetical protein n=1 Tax=Streptomyces sp. V1I1 TaxID=3042272 RepID=UPI002784E727|nr:hypothetical protein [Streptomyces sp. V1I1]MDQ0943257.1 hypothetical protein [Streptomyces sp. V1I1]